MTALFEPISTASNRIEPKKHTSEEIRASALFLLADMNFRATCDWAISWHGCKSSPLEGRLLVLGVEGHEGGFATDAALEMGNLSGTPVQHGNGAGLGVGVRHLYRPGCSFPAGHRPGALVGRR